jgi:phage/plasmid primase-like uncharacterized protein
VSVCTAETALGSADLERFDPQPLLRGDHADYLCPFCHDERPGRRRDNLHRKLRVWSTGGWNCVRCGRHGFLEDRKHGRDEDPPRPRHRRATPPREPSAAEIAESAAKRETLKRLWAATVAIGAPAGAAGADYLWSRGIVLLTAVEARVRFAADWYGRPAVVFPVQDAAGRLVAAEGRYIDAGAPKSRSAGRKSAGVFAAPACAIGADVLVVVEGPITALSIAACGLPTIALCGHALRTWLAAHLAGRVVFVALDWYEPDAERHGRSAFAALHAVGARPYRLTLPVGAGDWNDHLRSVGLPAMRAELEQVLNLPLKPTPKEMP